MSAACLLHDCGRFPPLVVVIGLPHCLHVDLVGVLAFRRSTSMAIVNLAAGPAAWRRRRFARIDGALFMQEATARLRVDIITGGGMRVRAGFVGWLVGNSSDRIQVYSHCCVCNRFNYRLQM